MKTTAHLANEYLLAAQALADRMLEQMKTSNPEMANATAAAVAQGNALALSYLYGEDPEIQLAAVKDDGRHVAIASIPLRPSPRVC